MQPQNTDITPESQKNQQETPVTVSSDKPIENGSITQESAPTIKTEENQANWRIFRAKRDVERKEREEALKRASEKEAEAQALKLALEAIMNKPTSNTQSNEYALQPIQESEDQKIERKIQEGVKKHLEQYEHEQIEKSRQEEPKKLMKNYPDFEKVVTQENCDYVEYHHPEVAIPFKYMPEGYEKWEAQYKVIKKFIQTTDMKKDQARLEKNVLKPGSASSVIPGAVGVAKTSVVLDEERKAANWARMQKTLKGVT
jgi:flagellar biosynthesis GTPase FlhF